MKKKQYQYWASRKAVAEKKRAEKVDESSGLLHTWHARWGGVQCGLLTFLTATPKCLRRPERGDGWGREYVQKRGVQCSEKKSCRHGVKTNEVMPTVPLHYTMQREKLFLWDRFNYFCFLKKKLALNFCKATKAKRSGEYWRSSSYPWWWQSWGVSRWIRPPIIAKSGAACMLYLLGPFAGICMHGRHQCANYSIMTNSFDSHRPKQVLRFV